MDSSRYFGSLETSGKARVLLRIARREPCTVQHGPRPPVKSAAGRQAPELFCLSLRRSRWAGVRQRLLGVFVRGCGGIGGHEMMRQDGGIQAGTIELGVLPTLLLRGSPLFRAFHTPLTIRRLILVLNFIPPNFTAGDSYVRKTHSRRLP